MTRNYVKTRSTGPDGEYVQKNLHRVLIENKIGRAILPGEVVHHKDHNCRNNDIDNLELMTVQKHYLITRRDLLVKLIMRLDISMKRVRDELNTVETFLRDDK
jgi:hypothetical protein